MTKQEIVLNWKDLVHSGCRVSFFRMIYDERHNIGATWAHVEHPSKKYPALIFYATHNCDANMTSRVDDVPHALAFMADLNIRFKTQQLSR